MIANRIPGPAQPGEIAPESQVGAWAVIGASPTAKLHTSYNISGLTDNGAGDFTLTFQRPFASASHYAIFGGGGAAANRSTMYVDGSAGNLPAAGSMRILSFAFNSTGSDDDPLTAFAIGQF
jgi:hypothetical protein